MAAPAKRRNVEENPDDAPSDEDEEYDSDEVEDEEEEEEEDEAMGVEMNVNFDAQTATDADFHGIKRLLHQLFLKANVNLSSLTDVILGQNHVGSVIKQAPLDEEEDEEEEEDEMETDADEVFGISTVINLTQRLTNESKNVPSEGDKAVKQIVDLLVEKSDKNGGSIQTKTLKEFLTDKEKHTGWLLNERFVNIPAQISLPLYDALRDEMHSACAKGHKFQFHHFLLMSKALKIKNGKKNDEDRLIFTNGEEELFHEESTFSFSFSVADQQADAETISEAASDEEASYESWRVVMIIPAEKMEVVAKKMTDILGASVEGKISTLR